MSWELEFNEEYLITLIGLFGEITMLEPPIKKKYKTITLLDVIGKFEKNHSQHFLNLTIMAQILVRIKTFLS